MTAKYKTTISYPQQWSFKEFTSDIKQSGLQL